MEKFDFIIKTELDWATAKRDLTLVDAQAFKAEWESTDKRECAIVIAASEPD